MRSDPETVAFLCSATSLTVRLGVYTNQDLHDATGQATQNELSYVFSNSVANCGPPQVEHPRLAERRKSLLRLETILATP